MFGFAAYNPGSCFAHAKASFVIGHLSLVICQLSLVSCQWSRRLRRDGEDRRSRVMHRRPALSEVEGMMRTIKSQKMVRFGARRCAPQVPQRCCAVIGHWSVVICGGCNGKKLGFMLQNVARRCIGVIVEGFSYLRSSACICG